jgi:hypothetical protein
VPSPLSHCARGRRERRSFETLGRCRRHAKGVVRVGKRLSAPPHSKQHSVERYCVGHVGGER